MERATAWNSRTTGEHVGNNATPANTNFWWLVSPRMNLPQQYMRRKYLTCDGLVQQQLSDTLHC
jgi:hypothetical protein